MGLTSSRPKPNFYQTDIIVEHNQQNMICELAKLAKIDHETCGLFQYRWWQRDMCCVNLFAPCQWDSPKV